MAREDVKEQQEEEQALICPNCGRRLNKWLDETSPGVKFSCPKCGVSLYRRKEQKRSGITIIQRRNVS